MTNLPTNFEDGLGDDVDRFLSDSDESSGDEEEKQPEQVAPQSPIVEAIGKQVAEDSLFGCLVLAGGLFYVVEWFKRNLGR